jgi:hypothetical protein
VIVVTAKGVRPERTASRVHERLIELYKKVDGVEA